MTEGAASWPDNPSRAGRVKWFDNRKGYGFIACNDLADVFVHYSAIRGDGYRTLEEGVEVRFEVIQTPKGLQATNVVPVR